MVYFVCEGCNETLKKAQVEKHALRCRQCHAVTCVDCSQTFYGNDFESHTTCISEAEKYEGSLYKAKKATKQSPQEAWMSVVEEAARTATKAPPSIQSHLSRLCDFGNVPRNQKKFGNFVKNSLRIFSDQVIDMIWKHLEDLRVKSSATESESESAVPPTVDQKQTESGQRDDGGEASGMREKKESKKRKAREATEETAVERDDAQGLPAESLVVDEEKEARKEAKRARKEAKRAKKAAIKEGL